MSKSIIIIGGGPAGIEAAKAAAGAGGQVTLISEGPVGGRAGWHSLLPSKVWLTAADTVGLLSETDFIKDAVQDNDRTRAAAILTQIQAIKESWYQQQIDQLKFFGVEILNGLASFESAHEILVKNEEDETAAHLQGEAIIVATGSVPVFPPNLRPDGQRILAPRFASHIKVLPEDVVVIGAGATGCEFVYLFNRLGVNVTWIVDPYGVLPAFAPAAGHFLADIFIKRGVKAVRDQFADRIETDGESVKVVTSNGDRYPAGMAFVAIGRRPDLSRLNLESAGLQIEPGKAPATDAFGQTELPGLYAVGDAAGVPMLANRAMAQAWVAGQHAAGGNPLPFRPETVVHAIYCEPQVAQVGTVAGDGIQTVRLPFTASLKAHLVPEGEGFIELAYNNHNRRIVGSLAVGLHAADVLAPVALAIQKDATLDDLASLYGAHPTLSELVFMAARSV